MRVIEEVFNIIAPHECLGCRAEGSLLCYECSLLLTAVPARCYVCGRWDEASRTCKACRKRTSIHSLWTVTKYEGVVKQLLHRLKFERAGAAAIPISKLMAAKCAIQEDVIVTYIPTASSRARERGYDQAALIARGLAKRLGCPFVPCLARLGKHRQVGNSREVRKQQMKDALRPVREYSFQNKHVLLVDDVLTTGATCEAAARVLRQSGAKRVSAAVFAVA